MDVLGKERRKRENFADFRFNFIDFIKKIDEKRLQILKNFLGVFGASWSLIRGVDN